MTVKPTIESKSEVEDVSCADDVYGHVQTLWQSVTFLNYYLIYKITVVLPADVKHLSPWRRLAPERPTSRTTDNVGRFSSRGLDTKITGSSLITPNSARRGLVRFRRK